MSTAEAGSEQGKPCHWRFSLARRVPTEAGGTTTLFVPYQQVETEAEVPEGATDIHPLHEGDLLYETQDGSGLHAIHSHRGEERKSVFGHTYVQMVFVDRRGRRRQRRRQVRWVDRTV